MSTLAVLKRARALIERPEAWTKDGIARSDVGKAVSAFDDSAVCWCAVGAIARATGKGIECHDAIHLLAETIGVRGGPISVSVGHWQDAPERTHAEVLAAFDRAIANLEWATS